MSNPSISSSNSTSKSLTIPTSQNSVANATSSSSSITNSTQLNSQPEVVLDNSLSTDTLLSSQLDTDKYVPTIEAGSTNDPDAASKLINKINEAKDSLTSSNNFSGGNLNMMLASILDSCIGLMFESSFDNNDFATKIGANLAQLCDTLVAYSKEQLKLNLDSADKQRSAADAQLCGAIVSSVLEVGSSVVGMLGQVKYSNKDLEMVSDTKTKIKNEKQSLIDKCAKNGISEADLISAVNIGGDELLTDYNSRKLQRTVDITAITSKDGHGLSTSKLGTWNKEANDELKIIVKNQNEGLATTQSKNITIDYWSDEKYSINSDSDIDIKSKPMLSKDHIAIPVGNQNGGDKGKIRVYERDQHGKFNEQDSEDFETDESYETLVGKFQKACINAGTGDNCTTLKDFAAFNVSNQLNLSDDVQSAVKAGPNTPYAKAYAELTELENEFEPFNTINGEKYKSISSYNELGRELMHGGARTGEQLSRLNSGVAQHSASMDQADASTLKAESENLQALIAAVSSSLEASRSQSSAVTDSSKNNFEYIQQLTNILAQNQVSK